MLRKTNRKVRECLDRALEARRAAHSERDPEMRAFYRRMEESWSRLAESYAFTERTDAFIRSILKKVDREK